MPSRAKPRISSRKQPKQTRSTQLVSDILVAAAQVLARDGAHRFTTTRVAEKAGVSVGSLYQYFPSKEAILFRLQTDEWAQTTALLDSILTDTALPPFERIKKMIAEFFRTELEEVGIREGLGDAAALYRDVPEVAEHHESDHGSLTSVIRAAVPGIAEGELPFATHIVKMTIGALGKSLSEERPSAERMRDYARAAGDMVCAYLETLAS